MRAATSCRLLAAALPLLPLALPAAGQQGVSIQILNIGQQTAEVRVLDPYRAKWYADQGLDTICPTRVAIDMLEHEIRETAERGTAGAPPAGAVDHDDADR